MIVSTVANLAATFILIALFCGLLILFLKDEAFKFLPVALIAAIIVEFVLYQKIIKILFVKLKLDEKLDPLFSKKRR